MNKYKFIKYFNFKKLVKKLVKNFLKINKKLIFKEFLLTFDILYQNKQSIPIIFLGYYCNLKIAIGLK